MVEELVIPKVWKLQKEQPPPLPQQQSTYFKTEYYQASEMRLKRQEKRQKSKRSPWALKSIRGMDIGRTVPLVFDAFSRKPTRYHCAKALLWEV
jgi:hypothetical protein